MLVIDEKIREALRKAVLQENWDEAQKLENLLKTHRENKKFETDEEVARMNLEKTRVEIDKMFLDRKFSLVNVIFGSGLVMGLLNLIKDLPFIKQFFK